MINILFTTPDVSVSQENKQDKSVTEKTHIGVENFSETVQVIKCIVPILHQNFWRKFAPQDIHVVTISRRHLDAHISHRVTDIANKNLSLCQKYKVFLQNEDENMLYINSKEMVNVKDPAVQTWVKHCSSWAAVATPINTAT